MCDGAKAFLSPGPIAHKAGSRSVRERDRDRKRWRSQQIAEIGAADLGEQTCWMDGTRFL